MLRKILIIWACFATDGRGSSKGYDGLGIFLFSSAKKEIKCNK